VGPAYCGRMDSGEQADATPNHRPGATSRHFFHEVAPASRPYFVLPIYDDEVALYRSEDEAQDLAKWRSR
jgi:hypothetical protein